VSFGAPLGLLALLALPAIVILHLFRRRLRQRRVAGLFLFREGPLVASAGRRRTRLMRSLSLLCELLAALCAALLLGGLDLGAGGSERHLVVVLDDSASMSAIGPDGSPADRARAAVAAAAQQAGRVTLVLTGARPTLRLGPRESSALAAQALADWTPSQPAHDPGPALALALELAGPEDRMLVLTDDPQLQPPPRCELAAVGAPLGNAALLSARRLARPGGETLLADVGWWGPTAGETTLRVESAAGASLLARSVALEPGQVAHLSLDLTASREDLWVRLSDDALALDNEALLLPEPARTVRVASLLDAEAARLLALERALAALEGVETVTDPAAADLLVTGAPGALAQGRTELVVGAPGAERNEWIGPFLMDRRHPLVSGLSLQGVVWSAAPGELDGVPLVLAGRQPLLAEAVEGSATRVLVDLDPARSNFAQSPDWPILLANVVERARATLPGPELVNVRVGDALVWRPPHGDVEAACELVGPDGARQPSRGGRPVVFEARRTGLHVLEREGAPLARYSVRFADARESDLSGRGARSEAARQPPQAAGAGAAAIAHGSAGRVEARWLAALMLLAVAGDWLALRRRGGEGR
jgi:Ca-activated chloride channel family protein